MKAPETHHQVDQDRPRRHLQRHLQHQQARSRGPVSALLGHDLRAIDPVAGVVDVAFLSAAHLFNPMGVMQGGFTMAMLAQTMTDTALALAPAHELTNEQAKELTNQLTKERAHDRVTLLEMQCNYLTAVGPGPVRCQGRVVRQGRTTVFLAASLFDHAGQLAATATAIADIMTTTVATADGAATAATTNGIAKPPQ